MGNPSDDKLHALKAKYSYVTNNHTHAYDTCLCAKQKKLPFCHIKTSLIKHFILFFTWIFRALAMFYL